MDREIKIKCYFCGRGGNAIKTKLGLKAKGFKRNRSSGTEVRWLCEKCNKKRCQRCGALIKKGMYCKDCLNYTKNKKNQNK